MQRTSPLVITGWRAVLLAPIAVPLALLASFWHGKKTVDRSADEVAGFLRDFLDNNGGEWDWDEFESCPITDNGPLRPVLTFTKFWSMQNASPRQGPPRAATRPPEVGAILKSLGGCSVQG
ncbi:hypothetical protein [Caulobacter sp. BP25]|uniref:hypothetical protein n=1 Tax=Caulobacter sp. BP25 TaxID=2048900 RepID=UPI00117D918F|nr:hypothetical protein [Caulobacter sp. BP25]